MARAIKTATDSSHVTSRSVRLHSSQPMSVHGCCVIRFGMTDHVVMGLRLAFGRVRDDIGVANQHCEFSRVRAGIGA